MRHVKWPHMCALKTVAYAAIIRIYAHKKRPTAQMRLHYPHMRKVRENSNLNLLKQLCPTIIIMSVVSPERIDRGNNFHWENAGNKCSDRSMEV